MIKIANYGSGGVGKNHFDLGQFEEAIHRLDELLAKYPDSDSPRKPFVFVPRAAIRVLVRLQH
jgi:hypothetical protein